MKRVLSVVLAFLMLLTALPFAVVSAGAETYEDFKYKILNDGTVEITDYTGNATDLMIPAEIDGKTVTSIGHDAFAGCIGLARVTIPDSVTSIGDWAFWRCESLASIEVPDSVTSIGYSAFNGCNSLASIEIPGSVTSIGYHAFKNCYSLASIEIPDSVTSIGEGAFYSCNSLASVTIGNGVTSIGDDAFYNTAYYNDKNHWKDDVLYIGNHLIEARREGYYTVKAGTKTIADYAFSGCAGLASIKIPDSVTSIGDFAFWRCSEDLTIYGIEGSYAQTYAKENGINFEKIQAAEIGNVNGDEEINATDATLVLQYYAQIITDATPNFDSIAADVNNDGYINSTDATLILQYFAGIITSF